MGARFAGSQRVGDRRRRRLAVEADEGSAPAIERQAIPAPQGTSRSVDLSHTEAPDIAELPFDTLPIAQIVPPEWWKYAAGGIAVLGMNCALVAAAWFAPQVSAVAGPAAERIFSPANGPATKWCSGLLLGLSAQMALLIWWARSRSLKDFDGRYWLWTRAAAAWLAFSGCLAIDARQTAIDVVRHFRPDLNQRYSALAWLIPASLVGISIARGLLREMRGCHTSRILFSTALAGYVAAVGFELGLASSIEPRMQALLSQIGLLTGNAALFFSMWVHARHVIHCSSEPAQPNSRTWRIPRPHFHMPRLPAFGSLRRRSVAGTVEMPVAAPKSARSRKRGAVVAEPVAPAAAAPAAQVPESPPAAAIPPKPRFRIDVRHDEPVELKDVVETRDESPVSSPVEEPSDSDQDQNVDDLQSQPDLRGMSKKQRRRILQELRDRERAATRG
jgi:hypothetical protein